MIRVENLSKEFKSNKKYPGFKGAIKSFFSTEYITKKAVDDISFEINDGEIVGYIGANGAGKSTTIKMMTGILTPTSGRVYVNNLVPYENREENAKNIGVVFGQKTQLWWDLPISETFSLLKDIYDVSDADFEERMKFLKEVLGLEEFFLSPVRTLSLGQRMRADLAAALIHNPQVIYLDEPTIGLDVVVKENVRKAIKEINLKYGTTIILTTHDLDDIEELCNRIIIIDKGKKIYDGEIKGVKEEYGYLATVEIQVKEEISLESLNIFDDIYKDKDFKIDFKENETNAEKALKNAKEIIKDTPISIDYTFTIRPLSFAKLLLKYNFNVVSIYADSFINEEEEDFKYIKENYPNIKIYATVHVKMRFVKRHTDKKILALGQKAAYFTGSNNFVNIVEGGGMYGFSSIEKLSNLMVDAFLNEKDMKKLIQFKGLGCENYETNCK